MRNFLIWTFFTYAVFLGLITQDFEENERTDTSVIVSTYPEVYRRLKDAQKFEKTLKKNITKNCPVFISRTYKEKCTKIGREKTCSYRSRTYLTSTCIEHRKMLVKKNIWMSPKKEKTDQRMGLIYLKPKCPQGYSLKHFKKKGYIKLRCKVLERTPGIKNWIDPEAPLNGRKLLFDLQGTPTCDPESIRIYKKVKGTWTYMCKKVQSDLDQDYVFTTTYPPSYTLDQAAKKTQSSINFSLPKCSKGWILRDFVKGDWVTLRCFKVAQMIKRVCSKVKRRYSKTTSPTYCAISKKYGYKKRQKKICLKRQKKRCLHFMNVKGISLCTERQLIKGQIFCTKRGEFFPKDFCVKYQKKKKKAKCKKWMIQKPIIYCAIKSIAKGREFCKLKKEYYGEYRPLRCVKSEKKLMTCEPQNVYGSNDKELSRHNKLIK